MRPELRLRPIGQPGYLRRRLRLRRRMRLHAARQLPEPLTNTMS
jgi:hypothetical protein